jgi:hypothetical protein
MKKRKKLMLFAILIFLLSASASGAYAYWAGTVNAPDQKTDTIAINIGEGKAVNTILTINDPTFGDKLLVPPSQAGNSVVVAGKTNVEELIINYTVNWSEIAGSAAGAEGTLKVEVYDIKINNSSTMGDKVTVTINNPPTYSPIPGTGYVFTTPKIKVGTPYSVSLRATLAQPTSLAEYNQIAGKPITMTVKFSVTIP